MYYIYIYIYIYAYVCIHICIHSIYISSIYNTVNIYFNAHKIFPFVVKIIVLASTLYQKIVRCNNIVCCNT